MLNKAQPPQGYNELQLANMVLHQLVLSHYADQIKLIVNSYHGNAMALPSLDSLVTSLCNHDIFDGKDFGGAPNVTSSGCHPIFHPCHPSTPQGSVSAVASYLVELKLHPNHPWVGQPNLSLEHVKLFQSLWKCPICQCNEHVFQFCPILTKNYKNIKIPHIPVADGKDVGVAPYIELKHCNPSGISFGAGTSSPIPDGAPKKPVLQIGNHHGSRDTEYFLAASGTASLVALPHMLGNPSGVHSPSPKTNCFAP